jgi:hypothetical protein
MTTTPSIKGSAISSVIEDVCRLRDTDQITPERLESSLEPADLALLDAKVQAALWYPIDSYRRLTELLRDVEGRNNPRYVADRGSCAAERLWKAGLYVQLQHGEEKAEAARQRGGFLSERDARLITTLSGAIFNFTKWRYCTEGGQALIEVTEAEALPDVSVEAASGFLEYVVSRLRQSETNVVALRPTPDRVEFRFELVR